MTPRKHYKALYLDAMKQVDQCAVLLEQDADLLREAREQSQLSTAELVKAYEVMAKLRLLSVGCGIVTLLALAFAARVVF